MTFSHFCEKSTCNPHQNRYNVSHKQTLAVPEKTDEPRYRQAVCRTRPVKPESAFK